MQKYSLKVLEIFEKMDKKQRNKLQVQSFLNLLQKLKDYKDNDVLKQVALVVTHLGNFNDETTFKSKFYLKEYTTLKNLVKDKYGLIQKGEIVNQSAAIGIAIGTAVGSGLMFINSIFIAVGVAIGIAIGTVIGTDKEKELGKQNKIF